VAGLLAARSTPRAPARLRGDAGQVRRGGAYPSGGTAGRRRKSFGAAVFVGGEGALVVADGGDEVLQLGRGEGVRGLEKIAGIGSSGRSSPGSGGQRRCSAGIHVREGGLRWLEAVVWHGKRWGELGAREEESERSGDGRTSGEETAWRQRGRGGEKGKKGGPGMGCHVARGGGAVGPGHDWQAAPASA
jgi:hypothetical protein